MMMRLCPGIAFTDTHLRLKGGIKVDKHVTLALAALEMYSAD